MTSGDTAPSDCALDFLVNLSLSLSFSASCFFASCSFSLSCLSFNWSVCASSVNCLNDFIFSLSCNLVSHSIGCSNSAASFVGFMVNAPCHAFAILLSGYFFTQLSSLGNTLVVFFSKSFVSPSLSMMKKFALPNALCSLPMFARTTL